MILSPKHLSGNKIRLYFPKYKKYLFKIAIGLSLGDISSMYYLQFLVSEVFYSSFNDSFCLWHNWVSC